MTNGDNEMESTKRSHLLHQVFTAHLPGGEWPEELDVVTVAHERSDYWAKRDAARPQRQPSRRWTGTAVNVVDAKGVKHLTSTRPAQVAPLSRRLSLVAAKADEIGDAKMGEQKRARLLRPVLFAVAGLCAKSEKAGVIEARRKRAKAKAAA
jgi:hypothetical protein